METAEGMIKAAVCLHNYLRLTCNASYCPAGFVDSQDSTGHVKPGEWRSIVNHLQEGTMRALPRLKGTRYPQSAVVVKELMKMYVISEHGAVPCQISLVRGHVQ